MEASEKSLVKKIGGRLYDAFVMVERELESINDDYFPLLKYLGLTDDVQELVDIVNSESLEDAIITAYTNKEKSLIKLAEDEQIDKVGKIKLSGNINNYLKRVFKAYREQTNVLLYPTHNKRAIEAYRDALYITSNGIHLKATKFIEMYLSRMAVEKSDTKKLHEEIAEKIIVKLNI